MPRTRRALPFHGERELKTQGHPLAAFADNLQGAMPPLVLQIVDVRAGRFRDPRRVERHQGDQSVVACNVDPGLDEKDATLVAVKAERAELVIYLRSTDV